MNNTMKDSGVKWIGDIPQSWNVNKIKYIASLKGRIGWQGLTSDEYQEEGAYLITGTDFDNGRINWDTCVHVPMKRWQEASEIQIENGDLLITKDGTVGKVALVYNLPDNTSLNSGVLRIITDCNHSRRFLFWTLQSNVFWNWFNYKNAGNSTIVHLYQGDFEDFVYAFPCLKEQEIIANYLDQKCSEIDGIISKIEKQIEKLNDYKKSLIHECVTKGLNKNVEFKESGVNWIGHIPESWSVNKIKYLATEKDTIFIDGDWIESDVICDEGIRYLTTGNVGVGFFKVQGDSYISQKTFNNLHCLNVVPGDLMISRLNEPIARACLVPDDEDRYVVAVDNVILRPNSDIDKKYLMYVMNSDGYSSLANITARGSTMSRISRTQLGQFFVPIPTYDEQKLIANYLDRQCEKINAIISKKQKQLLDIKQYKSSLIYEYVTGKKRVKVGE